MKKLVEKFGRYYVATFIIMVVGVVLFLLTPLLLWLFDFDSDIIGLFVFMVGLGMYVIRLVYNRISRKAKT